MNSKETLLFNPYQVLSANLASLKTLPCIFGPENNAGLFLHPKGNTA